MNEDLKKNVANVKWKFFFVKTKKWAKVYTTNADHVGSDFRLKLKRKIKNIF